MLVAKLLALDSLLEIRSWSESYKTSMFVVKANRSEPTNWTWPLESVPLHWQLFFLPFEWVLSPAGKCALVREARWRTLRVNEKMFESNLFEVQKELHKLLRNARLQQVHVSGF